MNKQEYIKMWSDKLSSPVEIIEKDYETILKQEKQIHPDLTPEQYETNVLRRLSLTFKKQLRSSAVGFEGIVFAVSDCIDFVAKRHREAKIMFDTNPQEAMAKGITNDIGEALDTRQAWQDGRPNVGYGKPLPTHNYSRSIIGVAVKSGIDTSPKLFTMNIRGGRAEKIIIPMFVPIRFRAIDKTQTDGADYTLNASTFTTFEHDDTLKLPSPEEIISQKIAYTVMKELPLYHEREKDNYNRVCVINGDVSTLNLEPNSNGTRLMVVEDAEMIMEDIESPGLTCWVPQHINIDFGEQSKVIVIGRTSQGKKRDEQGNQTDEPGDIMLNVMGVYALPQYKVNPVVEKLTEDNTSVTESPAKEETKEEKW